MLNKVINCLARSSYGTYEVLRPPGDYLTDLLVISMHYIHTSSNNLTLDYSLLCIYDEHIRYASSPL